MIESATGFRSATPELELILAIVMQAVHDLSATEEEARFEAHEFWMQPRGEWAEARRFYLTLLGLDEDQVLHALRDRLDPPERPEKRSSGTKKWSETAVYEVLPKGEFKAMDLAPIVGLRYSQITSRIENLRRKGLVIRVARGLFVRADCHNEWVARASAPVENEPALSSQARLLDALREGPKTMREIVFAFDGELSIDAIRQRLERAHARGLVEKEGAAWRIAA